MIATTTETYEHILTATDGPIATVTMNRPERRNALSLAHMEELIHCLKAIGQNKDVAAVILRGNGPVFCAGLLFSSSFKESSATATDFGANLLGAMVGGVGEYLSLLAGYRALLILVAVCYIAAIATRRIADRGLRIAD